MEIMIKENLLFKFTEERQSISQLAWLFDLSPFVILEVLETELEKDQIISLDKGNEELRYANVLINRNK